MSAQCPLYPPKADIPYGLWDVRLITRRRPAAAKENKEREIVSH